MTSYTWGELSRIGRRGYWQTTKSDHIVPASSRRDSRVVGVTLCGLKGTIVNSMDYTAPDLAIGIRLNPRQAEHLCRRCVAGVSKLASSVTR